MEVFEKWDKKAKAIAVWSVRSDQIKWKVTVDTIRTAFLSQVWQKRKTRLALGRRLQPGHPLFNLFPDGPQSQRFTPRSPRPTPSIFPRAWGSAFSQLAEFHHNSGMPPIDTHGMFVEPFS